MRVKVRLTNDTIKQTADPVDVWRHDHAMTTLGRLFTGDPLVASDETGWFIQSQELDDADDQLDGSVHRVADRLVRRLNGVASALTVRYRLVELDKLDDHKDTGARLIITGISGYTTPVANFDAPSAEALCQLADREPEVQRILDLFAAIKRESLWFDLYRIWDIMYRTFPSKKSFVQWLESHAAQTGDYWFDFEDNANNPGHGDTRRHAGNYSVRNNPSTGRPPIWMTDYDATRYIKRIFMLWVEHQYGVMLVSQHFL